MQLSQIILEVNHLEKQSQKMLRRKTTQCCTDSMILIMNNMNIDNRKMTGKNCITAYSTDCINHK